MKKKGHEHWIRHVCVPSEFSAFEGVAPNPPGVHSYSANISRSETLLLLLLLLLFLLLLLLLSKSNDNADCWRRSQNLSKMFIVNVMVIVIIWV